MTNSICPPISFVGRGKFGEPMYKLFHHTYGVVDSLLSDAHIVFLMVRPEQLDSVMQDYSSQFSTKLLINFTPKVIHTSCAMIHVASLPVADNRIKALTYKINSHVTAAQILQFKKIFSPLVDYCAPSENPANDLALMSRIFVLITCYADYLRQEGYPLVQLRKYFSFGVNCLTDDLSDSVSRTKTKGGITSALYKTIQKDLGALYAQQKVTASDILEKINREMNE